MRALESALEQCIEQIAPSLPSVRLIGQKAKRFAPLWVPVVVGLLAFCVPVAKPAGAQRRSVAGRASGGAGTGTLGAKQTERLDGSALATAGAAGAQPKSRWSAAGTARKAA